MSKFDAALIILQGIVDCPGTQRVTLYADFIADKLDELKVAIRVLEAAGKVDKAKSIDRGFQRDCFSKEEIDAIIARLRAADKLVAAWKAWKANPVKGTAGIVKAISDYEEAT